MARKNKTSKAQSKDEEPKELVSDSEDEVTVSTSNSVSDGSSPVDSEYDSSDDEEDGSDAGFEDQGSSSDEDSYVLEEDSDEEEMETLNVQDLEKVPRSFARKVPVATEKLKDKLQLDERSSKNYNDATLLMHTDDLSSDEEEGDPGNRIGKIPLHWYDEHDHIGYGVDGKRILKTDTNNNSSIEALLNAADNPEMKTMIYDALNAKNVQLTERQIELIRRIQSGAFAHPEFEGNPDFIDYFSSIPEISGLNSDRHENKSRFQPSKYERLLVKRLLHKLKEGKITMEYLQNKEDKKKNPKENIFMLWKGDEEDELAMKRVQHIAAPKQAPPVHAESYNPSEEYLPTEEELKQWEEMDPSDRPYGHFIPRKFDSLRAVGAYEHSVRERFERCLDLYLCPRVMKRRLNIDPESLVPQLPKPSDLRPYPTTKCVTYETPKGEDGTTPMIRCLSVSPDGQFLASGGSDGYVRLWEVQTGRLLCSWNLSSLVSKHDDDGNNDKNNTISEEDDEHHEQEEKQESTIKPVVTVKWNPNASHRCLIAAVGKCAVIISTGTGNAEDNELTEALLSAASIGASSVRSNSKAQKAVAWKKVDGDEITSSQQQHPISFYGGKHGPICLIQTKADIKNINWHRKGDYFVTVSPKAGTAAVLIHQLSKANSQQPFSKSKGEAQCAAFHPSKPFLFVANQQHVRVYHLVKQAMVKRLMTGCRYISSIDVHPSGDHVIVGSLDRKMVWFDLDLASTPFKTMKFHERALRTVTYHPRYPLMASSSDDGNVHIFHSMVYSDLMRNPLIVPVKILRGHKQVQKVGVLAAIFHPKQPWVFSAGADGKIVLWQDL